MNTRRKTLVAVVTLLLMSEPVLAQYEGVYGMQKLAWAVIVLGLSILVAGVAIALGLYHGLRSANRGATKNEQPKAH